MRESNSYFILHVSDFHITEKTQKNASLALATLIDKLKEMDISISYLIHTGDVINSSDIKARIEKEHKEGLTDSQYDAHLREITKKRFDIAYKIMDKFIKDLDVQQKHIVICCGNHDKCRFKAKKTKAMAFEPFQDFIRKIGCHDELTAFYDLDDLNVLVLNTNVADSKEKVTCIDCENLRNVLDLKVKNDDELNWFYCSEKNQQASSKDDRISVIVAHQPLYDICERIRLPYGSETQSTDFLSALQDFINGNGIYLCGDKHTSSIAASYIHDIPHYFCGHPFTEDKNTVPAKIGCKLKNFPKVQSIDVDYNLIEIRDGKIGKIRKIHLSQKERGKWECQIHPIDAVVSKLYEKSRKYLVKNCFALLAAQSGTRYSSWANLSWRNLFNRLDTWDKIDDFQELSEYYRLFCRLKNSDGETIGENGHENLFYELSELIKNSFQEPRDFNQQNILNIRGDYSSGKSTFLGLFYIYLLYQYNYGKIHFIPAYFNMENEDIFNKIQDGSTYALAVKQTFSAFVNKIEEIARVEKEPVCYIIDGLDEQDIWSESSQDSVGRVALDILSERKDSKYVMSFCQNKLACFKNTMPEIKYYETSSVMYFNPIFVNEKASADSKFNKFVKFMIELNKKDSDMPKVSSEPVEIPECSAIRKLRRLYINAGFIYHNYQYIKKCKPEDTVDSVYKKYIDQQHQICLNTLGYNFVHYAPAMAYFFTYEGYTYERFKAIAPGSSNYWERKIVEHSGKIYNTFIFIKKHKDAREYLLALHYNRELRYFAENPKNEIPENSIINKLIPRNISIIIKKLWRNDQNKFIIVCRNLIEKRKLSNSRPINKCTLSILTYVLAYLDKIPDYIRDEIERMLLELGTAKSETGEHIGLSDPWKITGNNSEKMKNFIDLNFLHSQKILGAMNSNSSIQLVKELLESPAFVLYNRQYMMWYYGDLTIYGENRIKNLIPGTDVVNKGIDYYNCFHTFYHKLYAYFENGCTYAYPLLEFDLFTMCDLVYSRQLHKQKEYAKIFFSSEDEREQEIYTFTKDMLEKYIESSVVKERIRLTEESKAQLEKIEKDFELDDSESVAITPYERILAVLERSDIRSDAAYVYSFFKVMSKLFKTS